MPAIAWVYENLSGSLGPGAVGHEVTLTLPASIFDMGASSSYGGLLNNDLCAYPASYAFGVESFTGSRFSSRQLEIQIFENALGWMHVLRFADIQDVFTGGQVLYGIGGPVGWVPNFSQPVSFRIANTDLTQTRSWTNLTYHLSDNCWIYDAVPLPTYQGYAESALIVLDGAGASAAGISRGRTHAQVIG